MEVLFWILFAFWCVSFVVWLCMIINRETRENQIYMYPWYVLMGLALAIQIVSMIMKVI